MKQRFKQFASILRDLKSIWKPTLILWGFFLAIWLFISISRLGFQHDIVGLSWGPPGAPVTFAQVLVTFVVSFLLTLGWHFIYSRNNKILSSRILNIVIFITLWASAVVLWSKVPLQPTHFSPPPMPPNNETYPNSDALLYDRASYHLLYNIGFADHLFRRPLYVGMLTLFHAVAGGSYDKTVFLQILLLAFIPSLTFLLTTKLSNHTAGLIAGVLILIREQNSIALSDKIITSHAKLMMSDSITTLGVILILYLAASWLFSVKRNFLSLAIIGACLGLIALVRAQVVIIVLPLVLILFLFIRSIKQTALSTIPIVFGIILVMSPWVWRNWNLTGTFVLDDYSEERLLARNYSLLPLAKPLPLEGETEEAFSSRLKDDIIAFIRMHPDEVLHFVSNHFLRNLATSAVYISPAYSDASSSDIVVHLPFWNDWDGSLTRNSKVALFLNLGILAFGIGIATSKHKWMGLLPLIIFLTYSLGNALVRSSGWRFNQPADWIIIIYYSMALAYLPSKVKLLFNQQADNIAIEKGLGRNTGILILLIVFLMGASVPIAERLIPTRNFNSSTESSMADLFREGIVTDAEVNDFLQQKNAVLVSGLAVYPRFVRPNSRFSPLDTSKEYPFLHFYLLNESDVQVILPLQNAPTDIPHTATVSVIGCKEGNFISAFAVIVQEPTNHIFLHEPETPFSCPLAAP